MIKAIVFDAYGTLISTGTGSVDATREILKKCGREDIDAEKFYSDWKKYHRFHIDGLQSFVPEEKIFRADLCALYKDYEIEGDADGDAEIMLATLGKRKAFDEVRSVLEALSRRFIICIGSTSDTEPLKRDVKNNKIPIKRIYTSESLRVYKPKKAFYQAIADDLGIDAREMLFVGDSLIDDVFGPSQIGMKTCFVDRRSVGVADIKPDYTIRSLDEILSIVNKI